MATIIGTPIKDTLNGTSGADVIFAFGGDDIVDAKEGDDDVFGADGKDILIGGAGNDNLFGGAGNDVLIGFSQASNKKDEIDVLSGGTGADVFVLGGFYTRSGSKDYARIADFSLKEKDKIQLSRASGFYCFIGNGKTTEIYNNDDLIARIENVNLGSGIIGSQSWVQWI